MFLNRIGIESVDKLWQKDSKKSPQIWKAFSKYLTDPSRMENANANIQKALDVDHPYSINLKARVNANLSAGNDICFDHENSGISGAAVWELFFAFVGGFEKVPVARNLDELINIGMFLTQTIIHLYKINKIL